MSEIISQLPAMAVICGALLWTINAIVNPLRDAIKDLKDAVNDLKASLELHRTNFHKLEVLVQEVDDRSRGNQRRIEALEVKHDNCRSIH